jgi:hypothetical protein
MWGENANTNITNIPQATAVGKRYFRNLSNLESLNILHYTGWSDDLKMHLWLA